jgi:hypothetical protein
MQTALSAASAVMLAAVILGSAVVPSAAADPASAEAMQPRGHYEWQYHYGGSPRHPHWEGRWVLVE